MQYRNPRERTNPCLSSGTEDPDAVETWHLTVSMRCATLDIRSQRPLLTLIVARLRYFVGPVPCSLMGTSTGPAERNIWWLFCNPELALAGMYVLVCRPSYQGQHPSCAYPPNWCCRIFCHGIPVQSVFGFVIFPGYYDLVNARLPEERMVGPGNSKSQWSCLFWIRNMHYVAPNLWHRYSPIPTGLGYATLCDGPPLHHWTWAERQATC